MRARPLTRLWRSLSLSALLAIACVGIAQAKTCTITGASTAFGLYDPTSNSNLDATGTVTLTCDGNFNAVLSLSIGNGAGASFSSGRKMTRAGGGTLTYNLYTNATYTQVLGDGTGGSVTLVIGGINTLTQPIWGRVPGGQRSALAGSYVDTVVATISY